MKVKLTVIEGPHKGREFAFEEHSSFIAGRSKKAQFRLPKVDQYFSRSHFLVELNPPLCRLLDLESRNGTHVNGERIQSVELKSGDTIEAGETIIRVTIEKTGKEDDDFFEGAGSNWANLVADSDPKELVESNWENLAAPSPELLKSDWSQLGPNEATKSAVEAKSESDWEVLINPAEETGTAPKQAVRPRLPEKETPKDLSPFRQTLVEKPGYPAGWIETGDFPSASNDIRKTRMEKTPLSGKSSPAHKAAAKSLELPAEIARLLPEDYRQRIDRNPQRLPGYLVVDELGRGGMGLVYRAISIADKSIVAIKTVLPAARVSESDFKKFHREASILSKLDHPNIVRFREVGEVDGVVFFAMDFVDGIDGAQWLKKIPSPTPIGRAIGLINQLLDALAFAHELGYIHRDIKPSNLLIRTTKGEDHVHLTDFGLARTYQSSRFSGLTMTGSVGGTTPYMPPEQITAFREATPAADQYAAAATLYHLLTRANVYEFPKEVAKQLLMILSDDPIPILDRRKDIPRPLAAVIHKALQREPEDRFANVSEFQEALAPFSDK